MSSFFGALTSGDIRMPEARFNEGGMLPPLSTAGYGNGLDGTADGRFNAGDSLLSSMEPYAYGKGDRLSTQTAYLANPHNIQKIIPQLMLPDTTCCKSAQTFMLAHGVSDGDIAFSIRFSAPSVRTQLMHHSVSDYFRQGAGRAVDYICNMATINYLIRGLCTHADKTNPAWGHFACAIGFEDGYDDIQKMIGTAGELVAIYSYDSEEQLNGENIEGLVATYHRLKAILIAARPTLPSGTVYSRDWKEESEEMRAFFNLLFFKRIDRIVTHLIRDSFRPIGVVIGSAKQGGQHECSNSPVTWPVSYVVTISIDGKNENICNYWRHTDISSGSLLGFSVSHQDVASNYSLNNNKHQVRKTFGDTANYKFPQLVPRAINERSSDRGLGNEGHWQFCMSQLMHQKISRDAEHTSVISFHQGALLQVTISVVWVRKHPNLDIHTQHTQEKNEKAFFKAKAVFGNHLGIENKKTVGVSVQPLYASINKKIEDTRKRGCDDTTDLNIGKVVVLTDDERKQRGLTPRIKLQKCNTIHTISSNTASSVVKNGHPPIQVQATPIDTGNPH
jgi:hypothetical protein